MKSDAAIYVHFPFCRSRCSYCDFDTFSGVEHLTSRYLDAVIGQIAASPMVQATTLYVGGGTPSLMSPAQAGRLVRACRDRFELPAEAETTLEANPADLNQAALDALRAAGFNRLSIGVQSVDDELLALIGRRHKSEDARRAVEMARVAGFDNISVDLIFGLPRQNQQLWEHTLGEVVAWGVEHLSCYALSLEPGTPMSAQVGSGAIALPTEDETVEMYETASRVLIEAGYRRYEISNWARPGRESRHNLAYWRCQPYLGIGAAAAGFWNGRRYKLGPSIPEYIEGVATGCVPLCEDEPVDLPRAMSDYLILELRLAEGVSVAEFTSRFGVDPHAPFGDGLEWGLRHGLLEQSGEWLRLTQSGTLLSNELFSRLL